jgi:2OG-Fe(II) oxygenase superfamily
MDAKTSVKTSVIQPMRAPHLVIDDFLPLEVAARLRADIERHFAEPGRHQRDTHQVWNYWFVPGLYTYLRTAPEKILQRADVDLFAEVLSSWSASRLGLRHVTWPYLSLYVDGCRQNLHNDSANGAFAFVYSLTRNERKTTGGETIVLHEGDLFRDHVAKPQAGRGLYDAIEPRFNRLVVFDDRLVHGVERIEGSMDPREGRVVLHGHLRADGPLVAGALSAAQVDDAATQIWTGFLNAAAARARLYHGPIALRFQVAASGQVESCAVLMDRVVATDASDVGWPALANELVVTLGRHRFPLAEGPTVVIQPFLFGDAPRPRV